MLLAQLESEDKLFESSSYFLDEQIRRAVVLLEPQLEKKHLELEINLEPIRISANEEALSHIWINLLENAIKFSPQGAPVGVSLKSDGAYASVSIADHGVGMDEEVKRNIFDKFYQSDESRITEGSGLGLSLVKRILQLCEGEITVESTLGEGSCFTVLLPKNF